MTTIPARYTNNGQPVGIEFLCAKYNLSDGQYLALCKIMEFLHGSGTFFTLSGYAGTGKSFLTKVLVEVLDVSGMVFTAPTNKATKVLRKFMTRQAVCKTIYSLLGIKMVADNEYMTLEFPRVPVNLQHYRLIVVDEASMLGRDLFAYLQEQARSFNVKFLLIGDRAQLPPVGETESPAWELDCPKHSLDQVMRFDNELLKLATSIRQLIQTYPGGRLEVETDHGTSDGVWVMNRTAWHYNIRKAVRAGLFTRPDHTKIIAWRNKTVSSLNHEVRLELFAPDSESAPEQYLVGDRILIQEPVLSNNVVVANIDDEGSIIARTIGPHSIHEDLSCYHLTVKFDEGPTLKLVIIHESSDHELQTALSVLASEARVDKRKWGYFWALRNSFHKVRYGYAITSHRSQGSSYLNVFVDSSDILANSDRFEALRCLYVASTRASSKLLWT